MENLLKCPSVSGDIFVDSLKKKKILFKYFLHFLYYYYLYNIIIFILLVFYVISFVILFLPSETKFIFSMKSVSTYIYVSGACYFIEKYHFFSADVINIFHLPINS